MRRGARQLDDESRALRDARVETDAPTDGFDETATNGETEPGALADFLGRDERLEQPVDHFRIDPGSVVLDRKTHAEVRALGGDAHVSSRTHRVRGVQNEIQHDLN